MKNIILGLLVILTAAPAFASRARLEALGESKFGSYYINDDRNIFLNPAQMIDYKKKAFFEFGGDPQTPTSLLDRSVLANRAQGGYVSPIGDDMAIGVYYNNTTDRALDFVGQINGFIFVTAGSATNTFIAPDSQIEVLLAGKGGMGWGLSLLYAGNNTKTANLEKTASVLGARLGLISGDLQLMSTVGLLSKSEVLVAGATNELKGKLSIDFAATYKMDDQTLFGKFTIYGADVTNQTVFATTTPTELRNIGFGVGMGRKHEMTKSTNMYCRFEADYLKQGVEKVPATLSAALAAPAVTYWNVPLVVGAESQALDWLAIRGSIQYSLVGQQIGARGLISSGAGENTMNSLGGTTTVAAGVGMTFGDLQIDGLVATNGTQPAVTGYGTQPGFGTAPMSNTSFGFGNGMLSRIAATYSF
ncbi:MAG: hypothetical protein JST80_09655 [Bdellovibrionales bacterium]|nr:hypothetical protein [Bdellovibrionales bacterium]